MAYSQQSVAAALHQPVISICVRLASRVSAASQTDYHVQLYSAIVSLFLDNDTAALYMMCQQTTLLSSSGVVVPALSDFQGAACPWRPLHVHGLNAPPTAQLQLIPLLTAVAGTRQRGEGVVPREEDLLAALMAFAVGNPGSRLTPDTGNDYDAYLSAVQCYAALVNKWTGVDQRAERAVDGILAQVAATDASLAQRVRSVVLFSWLLKAMVMRGDKHAKRATLAYCDVLLDTSAPAEVRLAAAHGFRTIVHDCRAVLNKGTHAFTGVMKLYKQKFFAWTFPVLSAAHQQSTAQRRGAMDVDALDTKVSESTCSDSAIVLMGITLMLEHVPKAVFLSQVSQKLGLLVESITSKYFPLRLASLRALQSVLADSEDMKLRLEPDLASIVPVLLDLSVYKKRKRARIDALSCLAMVAEVPAAAKFQRLIVRSLDVALGDPKQEVRKLAAFTRNKWYLINTK
jgi:hypothetical protein